MPALSLRTGSMLVAVLIAGTVGLAACDGQSSKSSSSSGLSVATADKATGALDGVAGQAANAAPSAAASASAGSGFAASTGASKVDTSTPLQTRQVIRTAVLGIEVADVDKAAAALNALAGRLGGRVDQDDRSGSKPADRTAQLILRLVPTTLDRAMIDTDALGHEVNRTLKGEDVTAATADLNARVAALRTSVNRLQALLGSSANLPNLLSLESELTQRQASLDSIVAQQRALSDQVALATLTVNISRSPIVVAAKTTKHGARLAGFGSALSSGLHGLRVAGRVVLAGLGYSLPFLPIVAVMFGAAYVWRRHHRHTDQLAAAAESS